MSQELTKKTEIVTRITTEIERYWREVTVSEAQREIDTETNKEIEKSC